MRQARALLCLTITPNMKPVSEANPTTYRAGFLVDHAIRLLSMFKALLMRVRQLVCRTDQPIN
jgi:hypothetical protein